MAHNIFDSHSHYDDNAFDDDRFEVLEDIHGKGVAKIMHAATDISSSIYGVKTSEKYDFHYTSIGIHPENIGNLEPNYIEQLTNLANNKKVKAIGEIGLDYHYDGFNAELQKEVFIQQLSLAKQLDLPVIIHIRDSTEDCLSILKEYKPRGVVHCFSGSVETAKEILDIGMHISFTGVLTFKNAKKAVKACEFIPIDRILLETDCPYMAPEPFRGKRCDSLMIEYIAAKMGEIKGLSTQQVLDLTYQNACRLFNIEV